MQYFSARRLFFPWVIVAFVETGVFLGFVCVFVCFVWVSTAFFLRKVGEEMYSFFPVFFFWGKELCKGFFVYSFGLILVFVFNFVCLNVCLVVLFCLFFGGFFVCLFVCFCFVFLFCLFCLVFACYLCVCVCGGGGGGGR